MKMVKFPEKQDYSCGDENVMKTYIKLLNDD